MIRDVYILKRTGEVLIHKPFSKRGVDETIFSGFYSALSAFAEELGHGGIETIQMGDVSFYYEHSEDLLFAIAADKSHNAKDVKIVLTEVKQQFIEKYTDQVADWDGNPLPFQKFTKDIELIVSAKPSIQGEASAFALPFALDGTRLKGKSLTDPEITGDYILDSRLELAAVHLLLDDIRRSENNLKPLKEGCYEFIAKLLWPIWVVKSPDDRLLLIDGLKLLQPQVERGFVPPSSRYEALLNVNASPEYLAVMNKLTEEVRTAAQSTPFDIHVIPSELAQQIQQLARITNGKDQFGVLLPSRINYNQAKKEAENFFAEAINTYTEAGTQWTEFRTYFQKDTQKWEERINTEIITLEEHYKTRKAALKKEIDKTLTELAKEEEKELAEVDKWRQNQEKTILTPLQTSLEPLSEQISEQQTALEQFLEKNSGSKKGAETFISQLTQTLDQFNIFTTDVRNQSKETRKQIQQTQRELNDLDKQVQEKKHQVHHRFELQEKEEIKLLDALQEEREIQLQETQHRLNKLKDHATEIDGLINEHITHSNQQLEKFEKYLIENGTLLPTDTKTPIYIPIYLAGLKREDDSTKLVIIPPLIVPPSKHDAATALGQRSTPIASLSSEMMQYIKQPLETALANDEKFAKQVTRFSPRHNLLQDSHIESLLYSGLHAMWQSKLIPEHQHTQIKLACIDIYRSTNGNS
ncbi:MAG: hypothetical protein ACFFDJ_03550 [Candidatus Odinarchaeota archaeon]